MKWKIIILVGLRRISKLLFDWIYYIYLSSLVFYCAMLRNMHSWTYLSSLVINPSGNTTSILRTNQPWNTKVPVTAQGHYPQGSQYRGRKFYSKYSIGREIKWNKMKIDEGRENDERKFFPDIKIELREYITWNY